MGEFLGVFSLFNFYVAINGDIFYYPKPNK